MQNIQLKIRIGEDGILGIQMPEKVKNTQLEVLVVFQPAIIVREDKMATDQGWPPNFFDKTW